MSDEKREPMVEDDSLTCSVRANDPDGSKRRQAELQTAIYAYAAGLDKEPEVLFEAACVLLELLRKDAQSGHMGLRFLTQVVTEQCSDTRALREKTVRSLRKQGLGDVTLGGPLDRMWLAREAPDVLRTLQHQAGLTATDLLYTFCTDVLSWSQRRGQSGYVVVRAGEVDGYFINTTNKEKRDGV